MNDEELKQRIKYLIEHGGLWEDPHDEIRANIRRLYIAVGATLALNVVEAAIWLL